MKKPIVAVIALVIIFLWTTSYAKKWPVYAKNGMVVCTEKTASGIGVEILNASRFIRDAILDSAQVRLLRAVPAADQ